MKLLIFLLLICTLQLFLVNSFGQWPLRDTIEFQERKGLPNFFNKIKTGQETKIGFIGGSITSATEGWRPMVVSWMKEYYKNSNLTEYNAAIGGTNSKYGVFRIERDLLVKDDLDLIFVEFAVNDGSGSEPDIEKSIEGIIHKIWIQNPYTDICFVYTIMSSFLSDIENGKMNLTASKHDSIASYYNIPSIFWGVECNKMLESDSVVFYDTISNFKTSKNNVGKYVFTHDNIHPSNFGYQVYTDVLARCFMKMETMNKITPHEILTPIVEDNYTNAKMEPISVHNNYNMSIIDSIGQKEYLDEFLTDVSQYLVSENPEDYYSFTFFGNEIGISIIMGPSVGRFIMEVDGNVSEFNSFDGFCSYERKAGRFIKLEEGLHQVKIYPSSNKYSLQEKEDLLNNEFRKKDIQNNPEKYVLNELIFSHILFKGEIYSLGIIYPFYDPKNNNFSIKVVDEILTISSKDDNSYQISIISITGSILYYGTINQSDCLEFRLPSKGLFLLNVKSITKSETFKVINN